MEQRLTLMVHGQENCAYTSHKNIGTLDKYAKDSVHLISPRFGKSLFSSREEVYSEANGLFYPEPILLKHFQFNESELNRLKITIVGGQMEKCLSQVYSCLEKWSKNSGMLTTIEAHLPLEAVFSFDKKNGEVQTLEELAERYGKKYASLMLLFYCGVKGSVPSNIKWEESKVILKSN